VVLRPDAVPSPVSTAPPTVVIKPSRGWVPIQLRDLWAYRELLYFLAWRDVKVRYKQTVFGAAWAVGQPLLMMIVFTVFFGRIANLHYNQPYPLVVYTALVPWTLFAQSVANSSESLVVNANLVAKVYFPRLLLPIAAVGAFLLDFLIALSLVFVLMAYYQVVPGWQVALLPLFTLLALLTSIAAGIWLTALNVRYRDIRYVVPFLIQVGLFVSPVAYQVSSLQEGTLKTIYQLNPMAGVIEGFRWALLGSDHPTPLIGISSAVVVAFLLSGMYYFRRVEKTFADVV
jgi:homopolymeric O-antigen transport system permease protein